MRRLFFTAVMLCLALIKMETLAEEASAADAQYLGSTSAATASQPGAVQSPQADDESGNLSADDEDDFADDAEADVEEDDAGDEEVINKNGEGYEESEEE